MWCFVRIADVELAEFFLACYASQELVATGLEGI